jgi:hypothetical protein
MRKIALTVVGAVLALAGCAPVEAAKTEPAAPPTASSSSAEHSGGDDRTAAIGQWVKSEDGVRWSVTKLGVTHISQYASGGHPGDPALVVYVKIRNDSKHRVDLTLMTVTARTGADGNDTEQVFDVDAGFDNPDGTLAPGRTASMKSAFAVASRKDLKKVSIEVQPGFDYESGTFEGGI